MAGRVQTDGKKVDYKDIKKNTRRYPKIEFDKLQMYFGKPYVVDLDNAVGSVTIKMPTVGNVMMYGEQKFNETLSTFVTNTTSYRLALWDNDIDWNEISDFDLFCMLYKRIDSGAAGLMFDNLDFSQFELKKVNEDGVDKIVLYARVSTVRDQQLKERKELDKIFKKKEEKIDLMVEIERLNELKNMEEKNKSLQEMKKEGKKVILDQIEENKKMRLKQKEIENKERLELLKRIEDENKKVQELAMLKKKENEKRIQESL